MLTIIMGSLNPKPLILNPDNPGGLRVSSQHPPEKVCRICLVERFGAWGWGFKVLLFCLVRQLVGGFEISYVRMKGLSPAIAGRHQCKASSRRLAPRH